MADDELDTSIGGAADKEWFAAKHAQIRERAAAPNQTAAEPVWKIEVEIPMRIIKDVDHMALFTAVAEAAHGWEPAERDGWDVSVTSGIWALPDGVVDHAVGNAALSGVDLSPEHVEMLEDVESGAVSSADAITAVRSALRQAYLSGHDAGFAAANVDDPWAEQLVADSELADRIAGALASNQRLSDLYSDNPAMYLRDGIVSDVMNQVAPVLAARDAELQKLRLEKAELEAVWDVIPCGHCDDTGIMPSERWGRDEDGAPYSDEDQPCPKGCLPSSKLPRLRESIDELRAALQFAVATRQQYAEERDEAVRLKTLAEAALEPMRNAHIALAEAAQELRARNKAYGRASATIGYLRAMLAKRDAEHRTMFDTTEAIRQRDARMIDGLRGERISLWEERDKLRAELSALRSMLRPRLNGLLGALCGQGNELADEMRAAIAVLDSGGQADTEATEQAPPTTLQDPTTYYEGGDEDDPRYPLVAWALNSSATVSFAYDEGGFAARVSVAGETQTKGIALRSVTAEQIRSYANQLLAMVQETETADSESRCGESVGTRAQGTLSLCGERVIDGFCPEHGEVGPPVSPATPTEPRPWTDFSAGEHATATDLDGRTVTGVIQSFFAWSNDISRNTRARMLLDGNGPAVVVHAPSLRAVEDQSGGGPRAGVELDPRTWQPRKDS